MAVEQHTDYFALLGMPRTYHMDESELDRSYREKSKQSHPDRFATAEAAKRVSALSQSMELNKAYKTLRKPATRAEYLLFLRGVAIKDNEILDPRFLTEILEKREELQAAKHQGDPGILEKLEEEMLDQREEVLARVGDLFSTLESEGGQSLVESIKRELIVLRYVNRYLKEFDDIDSQVLQ